MRTGGRAQGKRFSGDSWNAADPTVGDTVVPRGRAAGKHRPGHTESPLEPGLIFAPTEKDPISPESAEFNRRRASRQRNQESKSGKSFGSKAGRRSGAGNVGSQPAPERGQTHHRVEHISQQSEQTVAHFHAQQQAEMPPQFIQQLASHQTEYIGNVGTQQQMAQQLQYLPTHMVQPVHHDVRNDFYTEAAPDPHHGGINRRKRREDGQRNTQPSSVQHQVPLAQDVTVHDRFGAMTGECDQDPRFSHMSRHREPDRESREWHEEPEDGRQDESVGSKMRRNRRRNQRLERNFFEEREGQLPRTPQQPPFFDVGQKAQASDTPSTTVPDSFGSERTPLPYEQGYRVTGENWQSPTFPMEMGSPMSPQFPQHGPAAHYRHKGQKFQGQHSAEKPPEGTWDRGPPIRSSRDSLQTNLEGQPSPYGTPTQHQTSPQHGHLLPQQQTQYGHLPPVPPQQLYHQQVSQQHMQQHPQQHPNQQPNSRINQSTGQPSPYGTPTQHQTSPQHGHLLPQQQTQYGHLPPVPPQQLYHQQVSQQHMQQHPQQHPNQQRINQSTEVDGRYGQNVKRLLLTPPPHMDSMHDNLHGVGGNDEEIASVRNDQVLHTGRLQAEQKPLPDQDHAMMQVVSPWPAAEWMYSMQQPNPHMSHARLPQGQQPQVQMQHGQYPFHQPVQFTTHQPIAPQPMHPQQVQLQHPRLHAQQQPQQPDPVAFQAQQRHANVQMQSVDAQQQMMQQEMIIQQRMAVRGQNGDQAHHQGVQFEQGYSGTPTQLKRSPKEKRRGAKIQNRLAVVRNQNRPRGDVPTVASYPGQPMHEEGYPGQPMYEDDLTGHSVYPSADVRDGNNQLEFSNKTFRGKNNSSATAQFSSSTSSSSGVPEQSFHQFHHITGRLGKGGFARVYSARRLVKDDRVSESEVAVKVSDLRGPVIEPGHQDRSLEDRRKKAAEREISVLRKVAGQQRCARFLDAVFEGNFSYIVMEKCEMSLLQALEASPDYNERILKGVFYEMLKALSGIHSLGVVHRDIKPDNFLCTSSLGGNMIVKLCDFGLAEALSPAVTELKDIFGTAPFMSPEMLLGSGYGTQTDMWSFGVVVYVMLLGQFPHVPHKPQQEKNSRGMKQAIMSGMPEPTFKPKPQLRLVSISPGGSCFLRRALCRDPSKRPTADTAKNIAWFRSPMSPEERAASPSLKPIFDAAKQAGAFTIDPNNNYEICEVERELNALQAKYHKRESLLERRLDTESTQVGSSSMIEASPRSESPYRYKSEENPESGRMRLQTTWVTPDTTGQKQWE